jgi:cytochrome c biogenesis protein ResB
MIAQIPRDPWRTAWQIATSDYLMAALLLGITAGLITTTWLPQMPAADPVAYAQWLSETQARFEDATPMMQALGLFTITRSSGFRIIMALLAGALLLRLVEIGDRLHKNREVTSPTGEWHDLAHVDLSDVTHDLRRWRYRILHGPSLLQADRWPWADLFPLLAHSGGLLLLIGLLVTHLWGWRTEGLIVQSGQRLALPGTETWIRWDDSTHGVTHSPGIRAIIEDQVPGIQIRADDGTGQPLSLRQTSDTEPAAQLTVALVEDQFFAIPEAQLIVRLAPLPDHAVEAHSPALIQIYRSPSGRLATEIQVEEETELSVDDVALEFTPVPYARLTVISNPGIWPTSAGLVVLTAGLLGTISWPARRLWLRKEAERVEAAGDLPAALTRNEGA